MKQRAAKRTSAVVVRESGTASAGTLTIAIEMTLNRKGKRKSQSYGDYQWDR